MTNKTGNKSRMKKELTIGLSMIMFMQMKEEVKKKGLQAMASHQRHLIGTAKTNMLMTIVLL